MADIWFRYLGNIWVLKDPPGYRREVVRYLDLIRTTESGRILCDFINKQKGWMAIVPYVPTKDEPVNAYARPEKWTDAAEKDVFGWTTWRVNKDVAIPWPIGFGTGKGSDVVVKYHPATWRQHAVNFGRILPGSGPGEVLYHEMLHGLRMLNGKLLQQPVAAYPEFDDIEEFYAILAANVYRTQRGFKVHRFSHHGFDPAKKDYDTSEAYYEEFADEIEAWFKSQRDFCLAMARTKSNFNPFAAAAKALGLMPKPPDLPAPSKPGARRK